MFFQSFPGLQGPEVCSLLHWGWTLVCWCQVGWQGFPCRTELKTRMDHVVISVYGQVKSAPTPVGELNVRVEAEGQRSSLHANIGGPFQGAGAKYIYPTIRPHKIESRRSMFAKFDEGLAMLIPKVPIRSNIRPLPQIFVPAVRLKSRLPVKMWAPNSICSSRAAKQNSSNPTLLRWGGEMLR